MTMSRERRQEAEEMRVLLGCDLQGATLEPLPTRKEPSLTAAEEVFAQVAAACLGLFLLALELDRN